MSERTYTFTPEQFLMYAASLSKENIAKGREMIRREAIKILDEQLAKRRDA